MSIFYSNKIVLSDDVIKGSITIEDGRIVAIRRDHKPEGGFVDLTDRFVLPGFVNIISDNYVKEVKSPYNKYFSEKKIFHRLDRQLVGSGVTTNFHTFHLEELLKDRSSEDVIEYLQSIRKGLCERCLIDHRIHLLFKLGGHLANKNLRELILSGVVDFITCTEIYSRDLFHYRNQYFVQQLQSRFDLDDEQAYQALQKLIVLREESALDELSYRIKSAKNTGLPFASDRFQLAKMLKEEYKTQIDMILGTHSLETLKHMKEENIRYAFDIESMIRSADPPDLMELLSEKLVQVIAAPDRNEDILGYVFEMEGMLGLPEAVNMFSLHPSDAMNMKDRGSIEVGKKADFIVVEMVREIPTIAMMIINGKIAMQYY